MKRAVMVLVLAALGATQVGCVDPCEGTFAHNGKRGVLNFEPLRAERAAGLQTQLTMLRGSRGFIEGPFLLTRDPSACFTFDDADIEVTLPPAFQGEPVTLVRPPGGPVQIEFKCSAPAGEPQEVGIRVMTGDEVRYEDALDVTCRALERAGPQAVMPDTDERRELTRNGYAVGGLVHVLLGLTNQEDGGLTGFGAVSTDGLLASTGQHLFDQGVETFRAMAPGQDPVLQIGSFQAAVPATLIDGWELKVERTPGSSSFTAWPVTAGGTKLDGMEECQWTASAGSQAEALQARTCVDIFPGIVGGSGQPAGQVCVTALGKTACLPVPPG